jgi:hypothetical protein
MMLGTEALNRQKKFGGDDRLGNVNLKPRPQGARNLADRCFAASYFRYLQIA